jgi:hypothetical protein
MAYITCLVYTDCCKRTGEQQRFVREELQMSPCLVVVMLRMCTPLPLGDPP